MPDGYILVTHEKGGNLDFLEWIWLFRVNGMNTGVATLDRLQVHISLGLYEVKTSNETSLE